MTLPEPERCRARLDDATADLDPPLAVLDLDALDANAADLVRRASGKPVRVASKSVRNRGVLRRVLARPGFSGVLAYSLAEALWLGGGDDPVSTDVVVGYPSADRSALRRLAADEAATGRVTLMVDSADQLDLVDSVVPPDRRPTLRICLDVDASLRSAGGRVHVGVRRSPVHSPADAGALARQVSGRRGFELVGLMAYEGQVAGVGDAAPGRALRNLGIRRMQQASMAEIAERRAAIVAAVSAVAPLRFVNGGGTGSLELTSREDALTELAAGSGFYAPALFDDYSRFSLRPAAGFALPVVRRPAPGCVTALGGGYVASGAAGADRLPEPWLPPGLHLDRFEGAGEVQTPLLGEVAVRLRVGDRVYMRHAKAGELCEHFDSLYLVEGDAIVAEAPTYRGEGHAFL